MDIFEKVRLTPAQLRAVADRRFDDAKVLLEHKRTNGAMYLGGFVVECLLKALLLEHFPRLQSARLPGKQSEEDRYLWMLCYRQHDLEGIVAKLPGVVRHLQIQEKKQPQKKGLGQALQSISDQWTIFARYSPSTAGMTDAGIFLNRIKELKSWSGQKVQMRF
jgi:hypothetical protein